MAPADLPPRFLALKKCNELAFDTEDETLAYSAWHLVERYARVIQVLNCLVRSGDLSLRKTRLTALEVGAGQMPALHAVRDFYADLSEWSQITSPPPPIVEVFQLYILDRAPARGHFNHIISEQLLSLGDGKGATSSPPNSSTPSPEKIMDAAFDGLL